MISNCIKQTKITFFVLLLFSANISFGQYQSYKLNANGDTINAINNAGQKVGKWVIEVGPLRGEEGYVEEGLYKKGEKDGYWRQYSTIGDLLAVEHYILGGKDGLQQYFNYLGALEREESWRGYNPDAPYDTIAIYGTGSNEIIDYKLVKAAPYSVKEGEWRYYDPGTGRILRTEQWRNNNLVRPNNTNSNQIQANEKPKKMEKPKEMLEWEKKNKGKKISDGRTGI
jgi:antitoxin component YwqK of YwqJK toxin-antitoxin module